MSTLNVNTLADELGTGGPDFVGMPSVNGDPVVESGSNTDGSWVKLAEGTQICYTITLSYSYSNGSQLSATWTFPQIFISGAKPAPDCGLPTSSSSFTNTLFQGADGYNFQSQKVAASGTSSTFRLLSPNSVFVAGDGLTDMGAVAFGRWK